MMQRIDVVWCGIPSRGELDAMLAAPRLTNVPQHWVRALSKARDQLDQVEQLLDGSEELIALVDAADDTAERAVKAFNR
jgi:hypothetical protein